MRVVPQRSMWAQVATVCAAFCLGPMAGVALSLMLTPESRVVLTVGPMMFGLVFFLGVFLWMGLGIIAVGLAWLSRFARGRRPPPGTRPAQARVVPPGHGSFVVLGALVGAGMGVTARLLADPPVRMIGAAWFLAGLGYGLVLWAAAHHGYLPFPEEE